MAAHIKQSNYISLIRHDIVSLEAPQGLACLTWMNRVEMSVSYLVGTGELGGEHETDEAAQAR